MSVAVSVGFTNVSSLAVAAFHLVYCFLSVLWFNHRCKDLGLVPRGLRLELNAPINVNPVGGGGGSAAKGRGFDA